MNVQTTETMTLRGPNHGVRGPNPNPTVPAVIDPQAAQKEIARQLDEAVATAPRAAPSYPPKIAKAILAVSRSIDAVPKDTKNTFHDYMYQSWENILNTIAGALDRNNLIIQQSEITRGIHDRLLTVTYRFTIINEDGEVWPDEIIKSGLARLLDQKDVADDKALNKCGTQAQKYFYMQLFRITTKDIAEDDADGDGRTASRKGPNPNTTQPTAPHTIETNQQTTFQSFATAFIRLIDKAATTEEVAEWQRLNMNSLDLLKHRANTTYADVEKAITARVAALTPKSAAAPRGPNPNAPGLGQSQQSKDVQGQKADLYGTLIAEIDALPSKASHAPWLTKATDEKRMDTLTKEAKAVVIKHWTDHQGKVP